MQIDMESKGDVLVVSPLEERFDASVAEQFKREIKAKISEGKSKVVLDLARVDFIDSSGIGAIISCMKSLGQQGKLALCGVQDKIMPLFKLTRLDRVLDIQPDLETAIKATAT